MSSGQASSGGQPWSIVLASREVWPFVEGGGIGRCMWAAARLLAPHADVSVLTSSRWRGRYEELVRAEDDRLPAGVRFAFADEPSEDRHPFVSWHHLWSLRLLEGAAALHPDGGPDILEVADYQAEGFAAAHARRGVDPRLRNTTLAVRLQTSAEMCARLNEDPEDLHLRVLSGVERFVLRFADALLWPGGNSLEWYADFYGSDALAPAVRCPLPVSDDLVAPAAGDAPPHDGPLRLLYLNRLERRKGIAELVAAVRSLPDADLALTVVGRDTMSGPNCGSMHAHLGELTGGDPRVEFVDQVPHSAVARLIADHHAVVVPTRWETFSYVVREALACNRPVLATPAGAIVDVVRPRESGWLARSGSPEDLAAALCEMLEARAAIAEMVAEGRPRAVFEGGAAVEQNLDAYRQLRERASEERSRSTARPSPPPRICAVIACDVGGGDPLPTLMSLERQRGVSVRSVLAAVGSGRFLGGRALSRAHAIVTAGAGRDGRPAAWAAGLATIPDELVLLLPAGAVLGPDFVARGAAALAEEPALAWVTAFVGNARRPLDAPLGNYELPLAELDPASFVALGRRSALQGVIKDPDVAPDDEAELIVSLGDADAHGLVLQEPLIEDAPRARRARRQLSVDRGGAG